MKFFVTNRPEQYKALWQSGVAEGNIDDFLWWISKNDIFQLDTETTMTPDGPNAVDDRDLLFLQLGDQDKQTQWVFEWTALVPGTVWHTALKNSLENTQKAYIVHNALFDYVVIKKSLGIITENIHDTFLMSKVLNTGLDLEKGYHSLAGCLSRFFNIKLDKEAQTTFTKDTITYQQFMYAADDVMWLYDLFLKLKELLESWDLWYLYDKVEREVVKVYGDMSLNAMRFDSDYWDILVGELIKGNADTEKELNDLVVKDSDLVQHLRKSEHIINVRLLETQDRFTANWGSNVDRKKLLIKLVPALSIVTKFTKPELKKSLELLDAKQKKFLSLYLNRKYDILERYLLLYYKEWLIQNNFFIKAGTLKINWASPVHKLYIFQFYYPKLQNTDAKALSRIKKNPIINKYKEYSKVHKQLTTYGAGFKTKYVKRNSTIAASGFRQILNTGRIACGILLQMPGQSRFRNGFLPPEDDYVFVDSDYSSAELLIMAEAANETAFIDAVKAGKDLHMMSASLIFSNKWEKVAEPECVNLIDGSRCDCKEHNKLRTFAKTISFGLAYGLSHIGLADRLDITKEAALELMNRFFATFPNLKTFFTKSEEFGIENNYIVGLEPTKRIRFFHPPLNSGEKSAIGRQSKNFPIQEANGSMLKIALITLRKYIMLNNFPAKLHLPVHDEILSSCAKDRAEEWLALQEKAMEEAADMFLEPGLLKVDSKIIERWKK